MPPVEQGDESWIGRGGKRRVGVEIEFGRLAADVAAGAVRQRFGGAVRADGPHRLHVEDTEIGDFRVELDWDWVHGTSPDGGLVDKAKEFLGELGREWVPTEIVTPPLPAGRLPEIDALVQTLVRLGAEGTRTGLLNGFGLHLNPSLGPADLGAAPILAVLQSYLLDAPALRVAIDVDPVRSLLPFVEPFPPAYVDHTLDPDYRPTMSVLIDDYLRFNPTRNRELDLLPLFAEIDRDRVQRAVSDPRVSARPTFHWRLPNADLEDPLWTVAGQWARWLGVEERSLDRDALAARVADRHRRQGERLWNALF